MKINAVDGKITSIEFENNDLRYKLNVKSFSVVKHSQSSTNPGKIIEDYRELIKQNQIQEANEHWKKYKSLLEKFIDNLSVDDFTTPDFTQIISTSDINRQELIEKFKQKIISNLDINGHQVFSENFRKTDPQLSIKEMPGSIGEKSENFLFDKPLNIQYPLNDLVIIDDTINDGETLEVLLYKLIDCQMIDENTNIQCFIIYNVAKTGNNWKKDWRSVCE